jgi:hypothetical protein
MNMNRQHVTLLVILDLSAAIDTVDHHIMLERLKSSFGIQDQVVKWFTSYLSNRSQFISVNGGTSKRFEQKIAYLKDRVLAHFCLFYTCPNYSRFWKVTYLMPMLSPVTINCTFHSNQIQCLNNCLRLLSWTIVLILILIVFTYHKNNWFQNKLIKQNTNIWICVPPQLSIWLRHWRIGDSYVTTFSEAKDVGFSLDSQMKCDTNVNRSCKAAFSHLFHIRRIRKFLTHETALILINSFVTSGLEYCNSLYYGLPSNQLKEAPYNFQNMWVF